MALLILGASACSFDRRKSLAFDLLNHPDGTEHEAAWYAALGARFRAGVPVRELESFAAQAQGECSDREGSRIVCELLLRGGFCWARLLRIEAETADETLTLVKFRIGGLGC